MQTQTTAPTFCALRVKLLIEHTYTHSIHTITHEHTHTYTHTQSTHTRTHTYTHNCTCITCFSSLPRTQTCYTKFCCRSNHWYRQLQMHRVGQNHTHTVYTRHFWLGNHQIQSYAAYIKVLANSRYKHVCAGTDEDTNSNNARTHAPAAGSAEGLW